MKSTIWLLDIDRTVCEDIPNEESWDNINCPDCGVSHPSSKDKCPRCGYQDFLANFTIGQLSAPMSHQVTPDQYETFMRGDFNKIVRCLKKYSKNKKPQSMVFDYLDYDVFGLYEHIDKNLSWWNECMSVPLNWDNYGGWWEVDHIKPLCHGDFRTFTHCEKFKSANSLQNLRACPISYNRLKGSRWDYKLHTWSKNRHSSYRKWFMSKRTREQIWFIDEFEDFYQKSCLKNEKTKLPMRREMLRFFER